MYLSYLEDEILASHETNKQTKNRGRVTKNFLVKRHPYRKKSHLGVKYSPVQRFDWESIFSLHFQKITYDPIHIFRIIFRIVFSGN